VNPLPATTFAGDTTAVGLAHGRAFADAIAALTEDRVRLCRDAFWAGAASHRTDIDAVASACWDAQRRYDGPTTLELERIADTSGVPAEHLLIANGFTDVVDAIRAASSESVGPPPSSDDPGQCTAVLVAAHAAADGHAHLAQTWDMHPSVSPHLRVMHLRFTDQPAVTVMTLCGGIGMIGMNEHGLAIGINNLVTRDGRPGVVWTSAVRRMLRERTAHDALDVLRQTPLAGAHHYLLLDAAGAGFAVEASPTRTAVRRLDTTLTHTNHCLAPELIDLEADKTPPAHRNTRDRLAAAQRWLRDHPDRLDRVGLRGLLSLPGSVCHGPFAGYDIETAGAVVMTPAARAFDAAGRSPTPDRFTAFSSFPPQTHLRPPQETAP
jgi:isopenicillin-N N-acyltransferase-like protein